LTWETDVRTVPAAIPFTPPHVSVHRVRIAALPGLAVDDEMRGRLLGKGVFAWVSTLAGNRRVGALIGRTVRAHLIHDGAAAALGAGAQKTAGIMDGPAIGVVRSRATAAAFDQALKS